VASHNQSDTDHTIRDARDGLRPHDRHNLVVVGWWLFLESILLWKLILFR
jgi:hypothetical protein